MNPLILTKMKTLTREARFARLLAHLFQCHNI